MSLVVGRVGLLAPAGVFRRILFSLFFLLSCRQATRQDACQQLIIPEGSRCLSLSTYRDKMQGAWLGQMIGVSYGQPSEFLYLGRMIPETELPQWKPSQLRMAFFEDDLYEEINYMETLLTHGLNVSKEVAAREFSETTFPAWHANNAARERLRAGIAPSLANVHPHSQDIDYQIESDFSGLISPGMPARVTSLGDFFGGLICSKDCVHGGKFMGCMYAEAFFTDDINALIDAGLRCIPNESEYATTIQDVLSWQKSGLTAEESWRQLESKYNSPGKAYCIGSGVGKEAKGFNINASFNGAYVVMGLLYGGKDPTKTLRLTTSFGQDSDCNPSSAMGILFTALGTKSLPEIYRAEPPTKQRFTGTQYTFSYAIEVTEILARQSVLAGGGQVITTDAGEAFLIPEKR